MYCTAYQLNFTQMVGLTSNDHINKKQEEKHNAAKNDNPLWKPKYAYRIRIASFKNFKK